MDSFINTVTESAALLKQDLPLTAGFVTLIFGIQIINWMLGYRLNVLGIWPRKLFGWIGIPFSPFLHGNFAHVILNAVPLFIFSNLILLNGQHVFIIKSIEIILLSGILIWLFGRKGVHIGASALIMGYLGYILVGIYHKPTPLSFLVGLACLFYFSGMLSNLLPQQDKRVSWEGHVFGFAAGIAAAFM